MSSAATDTTDAARRQIQSVSQRRQNKPLIEKRRRARINECLLQLKGLLMKDMGKETPRQSKLEKADILEMTVDYIKKISYNSPDQKSSAQTSLGAPFVDGFSRCLEEVDTFLDRQLHLQAEVRHKVLAHCKQQLTDKGSVPRVSQEIEPDIKEEDKVDPKVQDREPETFSKTFGSVRDKEFVDKDSSAVDLSRLRKKRSQNLADLSEGETDDSLSTEDVKAEFQAVDVDVGHYDRREKRARLSDSAVCGVDASDDDNESRSTVRILCEGLNREETRSPSSSTSPRSQCSVETAETVFAAKGLSVSSAESSVSAAIHAATSERLTQPRSETSNNAIKLAGPLKLFCGGNVFILVDQQQQQQQQQSQLQQQQHSYFKFSQPLQPPAKPHIQPVISYLPQPSLLSANSSSLSSCVSGTNQPYFLASGADVPALSSLANVASCVMEPSSFLSPISTPTVTNAQVMNSTPATSSTAGCSVLGAGGQRFVYSVYPSNAALGLTSPTMAAYLPTLQHLNVGLTGPSAFPSLAYQAPSFINQAVVPAKGLDRDSLFAGGALTAQGELTRTVGAQNDNVNTVTELSSLSGSPQHPFQQFSEGVFSGRGNDVNNNSTSLVSHGHSSMWRPW